MGRFATIGLVLVLFAGCGNGTNPEASAGCVQGQTIRCFCADGSPHVQTCAADGTFDLCACDGSAASAGDAAGSAAASGATGGQSGQDAAGAGGDGSAGQSAGGDQGAAGGAAEGGAGAAGSTAAGSGAGGGGAAGGEAGSGGSAGSAGQAGSGGDGGGGTGASTDQPYGPCASLDGCAGGMACVFATLLGVVTGEMGYCSPQCEVGARASECPQPETGSVEATCSEIDQLCTLGSCGDARCPNGMTCGRMNNGQGSNGNQTPMCRYPVR